MRVLVVHNEYLYRGGEDAVRALETELLASRGHAVETFVETNERVARLGQLETATRAVWSREAYREVRRRLRRGRHDVMHVHNFFPLVSPSAYYAARDEGVPVVQTLHNYRLLCLNSTFYRDGHVCEECLGKPVPWPGVVHRCYRGSRAGSAAVATMLTVHRAARTWSELVDVYVALTEFARAKLVEGGLPAEKIRVKPNFVAPDPGVGQHGGGYFLYVGRLSAEKGISTLLAGWERLGGVPPLKIVGAGPLEDAVVAAVRRLPGVEWLGPRAPVEVAALMRDAFAVVVPSECYETFGRAAIEAHATAAPVVASDLGAVAEVVEHGRTGLRFRAGDPTALAEAVTALWSSPGEARRMGEEGRHGYETAYTADANYRALLEIYASVAGGAHEFSDSAQPRAG